MKSCVCTPNRVYSNISRFVCSPLNNVTAYLFYYTVTLSPELSLPFEIRSLPTAPTISAYPASGLQLIWIVIHFIFHVFALTWSISPYLKASAIPFSRPAALNTRLNLCQSFCQSTSLDPGLLPSLQLL